MGQSFIFTNGVEKIDPTLTYDGPNEMEHAFHGNDFVAMAYALLAEGTLAEELKASIAHEGRPGSELVGRWARNPFYHAGDYEDASIRGAEQTLYEGTVDISDLLAPLFRDGSAEDEARFNGMALFTRMITDPLFNTSDRPLLVINHTKQIYLDARTDAIMDTITHTRLAIDTLTLLSCYTHGEGGGDFYCPAPAYDLRGTWAGDRISIDRTAPTGYKQVSHLFIEDADALQHDRDVEAVQSLYEKLTNTPNGFANLDAACKAFVLGEKCPLAQLDWSRAGPTIQWGTRAPAILPGRR